MPFGVVSAPALFQKLMDSVLQGIPYVGCYIDDIIITGVNDKDHLNTLSTVIQKLEGHGFRLKLAKCAFLQKSVEFLGHQIDAEGMQPLDSKVEAILQAPTPKNLQELRSFLGILNYYGKLIPNLATLIQPLNNLLQRGQTWHWSVDCDQAFQEAKAVLSSSRVLVHYDTTLPLTLAADASAYGIGTVISHTLPDGSEKPVAYASRSLSSSERNYAQVEKEALSLIFGIKKFHQYLYGRKFTLFTDHKPLLAILGPKKAIPPMAASQMQRWAVLLSAYQYEIKFKSTLDHANADGLSRLPLPTTSDDTATSDATVFNISQLQSLPVTVTQVQSATRTDPILSKVLRYTRAGWPNQVSEALKPFRKINSEITVESGCVLWGFRVIIPKKLQHSLLKYLHLDHPGASRMKSCAKAHFWWPGLDKEVDNLASSCQQCQANKNMPAAAPLHLWIWPTKPWKHVHVHVDYAGPFQGKSFLIAVDAPILISGLKSLICPAPLLSRPLRY